MNTTRVFSPCGIHLVNIVACIALKKGISGLFRQLADIWQ
jgi:hypothetical protein